MIVTNSNRLEDPLSTLMTIRKCVFNIQELNCNFETNSIIIKTSLHKEIIFYLLIYTNPATSNLCLSTQHDWLKYNVSACFLVNFFPFFCLLSCVMTKKENKKKNATLIKWFIQLNIDYMISPSTSKFS